MVAPFDHKLCREKGSQSSLRPNKFLDGTAGSTRKNSPTFTSHFGTRLLEAVRSLGEETRVAKGGDGKKGMVSKVRLLKNKG
jgi:hypothetical protein